MNDQSSGSNISFPVRVVVMGVCGCGKSEIGRLLAVRSGYAYAEGDDYHPASNVSKMAAGISLNDTDRYEWLLLLKSKIWEASQRGEGLVLSCSALKRRYRDLLRMGDPALLFVHLQGDRELIESRMRAREGHFMPVSLIDSQFRDLEPLSSDEGGIQVDIRLAPDKLIDEIVQRLSINRK